MQNISDAVMSDYIDKICQDMKESYAIDFSQHQNYNIKRGLRNSDGTGVIAGVTSIASVQGYMMLDGEPIPMPGRLYYRGIEISEIVSEHIKNGIFGFEEVMYLLLVGKLPTREQLEVFDAAQSGARKLPTNFMEDNMLRAHSPDIMNQLAKNILALYTYDPNPDDTSLKNMLRQSIELMGRVPILVATAYRIKQHYDDGGSLLLHKPIESLSFAENFLHIIRPDNKYTREEALLLDVMLTLHAEHGGGNNSTFTSRVLASTGTDTYGAISAAVSSLKGPLHGGANKKAMEMLDNVRQNVPEWHDEGKLADYLRLIRDRKANDGSGKIYGLGHAVYTMSDPRSLILKDYAKKMASGTQFEEDFELMDAIERIGIQVLNEKLGKRKAICANVDMYSGIVYEMLGIPQELYTPLFAVSRLAGWCAHRMEEALTGGRIMRPGYRAVMPHNEYVPMSERG
ncbi:MAG: citrate synthase [Christensenellales bacterium]|jgi:citrate synthase